MCARARIHIDSLMQESDVDNSASKGKIQSQLTMLSNLFE